MRERARPKIYLEDHLVALVEVQRTPDSSGDSHLALGRDPCAYFRAPY